MGIRPGDILVTVNEKSTEGLNTTEIADLFGRRLAIASETERGAELRVQLIKRLTGNARLRARHMRQDYFEFARTHKLILVTNNAPRVTEDTEAIWRRLRLVPFDYIVPEAKRDTSLIQKLKPEYQGIFAWMVRGCLQWQQGGLPECAAINIATAKFRGDANSFRVFMAECCLLEPAQRCLEQRTALTVRACPECSRAPGGDNRRLVLAGDHAELPPEWCPRCGRHQVLTLTFDPGD